MLFICYPKCSTCQKAKKWLDGSGLIKMTIPDKPSSPKQQYYC